MSICGGLRRQRGEDCRIRAFTGRLVQIQPSPSSPGTLNSRPAGCDRTCAQALTAAGVRTRIGRRAERGPSRQVMPMLRWLRSLFAWREVRNTGVHSYQQNAITGRRRVLRRMAGGYQPVDGRWLTFGEWEDAPHAGLRPLVPRPLYGWHAERRVLGVSSDVVLIVAILAAVFAIVWLTIPSEGKVTIPHARGACK